MEIEGKGLGFHECNVQGEPSAICLTYGGERLALEFSRGAPEYETQFALSSPVTCRRYSFADLMQYDEIKSWVMTNRLVLRDEERTDAEIRWVLSFVKWLLTSSVSGSKLFPGVATP
jgi:hypothetical protein